MSDSKVQIQIQERVEIINHSPHSDFNKKSKAEEVKQQTTPIKKPKNVEVQKATPRKSTPKREKKVVKEESKQTREGSNLISAPLEIKKMIENALLTREAILDSIHFPDCKNSLKIMQWVREISISSVKKIQSNIQRIKATEKKLKELQQKTKVSLKKKGVSLEPKTPHPKRTGKP